MWDIYLIYLSSIFTLFVLQCIIQGVPKLLKHFCKSLICQGVNMMSFFPIFFIFKEKRKEKWRHPVCPLTSTFTMLILLPYFWHSDLWSWNCTHICYLGLLKNIRNQICVTFLYPLFWGVTIERRSENLYIVSTYLHVVPYFNTNES